MKVPEVNAATLIASPAAPRSTVQGGRRRLLQALVILVMCTLFATSLHSLLHEYTVMRHGLWRQYLDTLGFATVVLSALCSALSYAAITGYEYLATRNAGVRLSYSKVAAASLVSVSLSHNTGMPLFTSTSLRFRFLSSYGVPTQSLPAIIAFSTASYLVAVISSGGLYLTLAALPLSLSLPFSTTRPLGWVALTLLAAYLAASMRGGRTVSVGKFLFPFPPLRLSVGQAVLGLCEVSAAALSLFVLLPGSSRLSFPQVAAVYLIASTLGLLANVPGGLGVLEATILFFLGARFEAGALLGPLLFFRLSYYLIPLLAGLVLLFVHEGFRVRAFIRDLTG